MEGYKILKVLLADDDEDDRFFFQKALDTLDFPCYLKTVCDGEKLINYLNENTESLPDVLFLDLNMPRKNGTECLKAIKTNDKLKDLPVIISSTMINDNIARELYSLGAHYYVRKCEFAELKLMLNKVLTSMTKGKFNRPTEDEFVINFVKV